MAYFSKLTMILSHRKMKMREVNVLPNNPSFKQVLGDKQTAVSLVREQFQVCRTLFQTFQGVSV